jgi:cell division protein FtsN
MAEAGKSSPWVWISLGLIIGLFVAFVLFLDQKIVKTKHLPVPVNTTQEDSKKPIFDFYTVLPKREVDIPEQDSTENKPNKKSQQSKQSQHAANVKYILQAGSFKEAKDAERQKAQLALVGLQSVVSKANVNGVIYYRVELGPYVDDGSYSEVKNLLIENDIAYIPKTVH